MLLKANGQYLNFKADVEIERHFLLLDDIDSIGDFSYSFEINNTKPNREKLGITDRRETEKTFLSDVTAELQTDGGITIYRGLLRVERPNKKTITASFFSGNSNWLAEIDGLCLDLNFSLVGVVEVEKTEANIAATWNDTEGLVFPIMDAGLLADRILTQNDFPTLYTEDFQQCLYAKTVMRCIFTQASIKLEGELFKEYLFDKLLLASNNVNGTQDLLNQRSARAAKTSNQSISTSYTKVTFTDDASFPNHNNGHYSIATSEWTADKPMKITGKAYVSLSSSVTSFLTFRKNGASIGGVSGVTGTENTAILKSVPTGGNRPVNYLEVDAGDVVTVEFRVTSGSVNVQATSFIEITPIEFTNVVANTILGSLTKAEFVSGVFKMFGVIPKYNSETKTLTCNLLKKLKSHTPVEIKGRIIDENYTDVVNGYGKQTIFKFADGGLDEISDYDKLNDIPYGAGVMDVDNSYIDDKIEIDIPFSIGYNYFNNTLGAQLTNCKFREFDEDGDEIVLSSVATSGGTARFTTATAHEFTVGDWVRIIETDTGEYVGSGKVSATPAATTFEITGVSFVTAIASGTVIKLKVIENVSDTVFVLVNISDTVLTEVTTNLAVINFNSGLVGTVAFSYTNMPYNQSIPINAQHRNTIFFDNVNIPGYYQVGLIENYYPPLKKILNDPDMILVESYINEADFLNLSSQEPIKFYSEDGYGEYYLNRTSGYKGSHLPCEVELIKL